MLFHFFFKNSGSPSQPLIFDPRSVKLTEKLEFIAGSADQFDGVSAYSSVTEDGISPQCLSLGVEKDYILRTNPLFVIQMYGLWRSELGDSDPDGYSNKLFDGKDVLSYGNTIVTDELNKQSGYDGNFTVETIQITNMWMAMISELYRAAQLCRSGKEAMKSFDTDFNPVDFAAALWFGTAQDANSNDGSSLYVWAKRAGLDFENQAFVVSDVINNRLIDLQESFSVCKDLDSEEDSSMNGVFMEHMVDGITRIMIVPLIQNFIHHLAVEVSRYTPNATLTACVCFFSLEISSCHS